MIPEPVDDRKQKESNLEPESVDITKLKEARIVTAPEEYVDEHNEERMVLESLHVIEHEEEKTDSALVDVTVKIDTEIYNEPIDVTKLNKEDIKEFLDSFDHVFSDCDGVIWTKVPLPRSGEFFELMKKHGKTIHYVSNNSLRTKEEYEKKFRDAGIENGYEKLSVPSKAIVDYFKSVNMKKKIYSVACAETTRQLESNGFCCEQGPVVGKEAYYDYVEYLVDDDDIGAVVFDSDFNMNLAKLYRAITYLKRPEVHFVNGATDRVVPMLPGVTALGTGIFTDIVIDQVKRIPVQLGKPGKDFAKFVMKSSGVIEPSRVLFIGDMIAQDIAMGKVAGFKTMLVLTTHSKDEMLGQTTLRPDYYAPSLESIVSVL